VHEYTTPMRIKTPKRPKRGSVIYIYIISSWNNFRRERPLKVVCT
jgi:hypothetical protein